MTISFSTFLSQLVSNPALLITALLTLGVIRCSQCHRHLCLYPFDGTAGRHFDGRDLQLFRRVDHDLV